MKPGIFCIAVAAILLGACGGGSEPQDMPANSAPAGPADAVTAGESSGYDRKTFVLCPAFENYREELASIVGFTQNLDRGLSAGGMKCAVRGKGGDFIGIEVLPAMINSIEPYAECTDTPSRETMITLATRVREVLIEANPGL